MSTATASAGHTTLGTIVLRLWPTDRGVLVAVSDRDPRPPAPRASDSNATGGRGLLLTQTMATRWGYYPEPPHPAKIVWAEVSTQPRDALSRPAAGGPEITPLVMGQVLTALREL
ncbi:hypothetical protein Stube_28980 [Streptomyces tubercidicus]|uniref:ATP-binding protein n=1 Tax=Streptomyces tubercidicus TaxID=47759 RepID=A0A640UV17_9ACTN|nr:hypothetical protein Stube_28980 [Streptomyces tubercidicus]